ncbi:MAG: hypothetical protein K6T85_00845 [Gorillibacterium sp.]|nr:hypothetical protein [Gorillibacterium sp.]
MRNVAYDEKHIKDRESFLRFFQEKYKTDESEVFYSPSQKYKLTVVHYEHHEGIVRHDYTQGIITKEDDVDYKVEIKRNFGTFLFQWTNQAAKDYLLCGQDYQGYTIVDLESQEIHDYIPEESYDSEGFCWAAIHFSHHVNVLVVEGCFCAAEYEIVCYDFSNPAELPYKEIKRISPYEEVLGWKSPGIFEYIDEQSKIKQIKLGGDFYQSRALITQKLGVAAT